MAKYALMVAALFAATDFTGVALIITSVGSLIAVVFTGYISVRQLPQVHKLVNATATRSQNEIEGLRAEVATLKNTALTKAEAREAFIGPRPPSLEPPEAKAEIIHRVDDLDTKLTDGAP